MNERKIQNFFGKSERPPLQLVDSDIKKGPGSYEVIS